nr:protein Rta [Equid gammaherpesvirus 5]
MEPKDFQPEIKPPKAFCIEQFVGCSKAFKEKTLQLITLYHECLINAKGGDEFMKFMYEVCLSLEQEMKAYNAMAGFLLECNLFNLWNLFRNYKNKQSAECANENPCALMAQQFLKFHTERLLVCTDRFFSTALCSGITMPYDLCQHMFKFQLNLRNRCVMSWKTLSGGRRAFMTIVQEIFACMNALRANELITPKQQAFFKLTYPPCRVQNIINILDVVHKQKIRDLKSLNMQKLKKRTPHAGIFCASGQPLFPIPEALLVDFNGEGIIRADIGDVSLFLQCPEEFLASDFFAYIKRFQGVGVQIKNTEPRYLPQPQQLQQQQPHPQQPQQQQQQLQPMPVYPAAVAHAGGFQIQAESALEGPSGLQYFLPAQAVPRVVGYFSNSESSSITPTTILPLGGGGPGCSRSVTAAATYVPAPAVSACPASSSSTSSDAGAGEVQNFFQRPRKATSKRKHQQVQGEDEEEALRRQRHHAASVQRPRQFFQGASQSPSAQPVQVLQQGAVYFMGPANQLAGDASHIPVISNAVLQSVLQQPVTGVNAFDMSQLQQCVWPIQEPVAQETRVPTTVIHYQPAMAQVQAPQPHQPPQPQTPESEPDEVEEEEEEQEGPLNLTTRDDDQEILEEILCNLYSGENGQRAEASSSPASASSSTSAASPQAEPESRASPRPHTSSQSDRSPSGDAADDMDIFSIHNMHLRRSLFK